MRRRKKISHLQITNKKERIWKKLNNKFSRLKVRAVYITLVKKMKTAILQSNLQIRMLRKEENSLKWVLIQKSLIKSQILLGHLKHLYLNKKNSKELQKKRNLKRRKKERRKREKKRRKRKERSKKRKTWLKEKLSLNLQSLRYWLARTKYSMILNLQRPYIRY